MEKTDLKVGDIVQYIEDTQYVGNFVVVTEPKDFGGMGYLALTQPDPDLVTFKGVAFVRFSFEQVQFVGHTDLIISSEKLHAEEENGET